MENATKISPIQGDAFKALVDEFAHDVTESQTFANMFAETLRDKMDCLADELAEKVISAMADGIDADDVVSQSGALNNLEEQLEDMVRAAVENISL